MKTPNHYKDKVSTVDICNDYNLNFNIGNVLKYLQRAGRKGSKKEDLEKALHYLDIEIKRLNSCVDVLKTIKSWNINYGDSRILKVLVSLSNAINNDISLMIARRELKEYIEEVYSE